MTLTDVIAAHSYSVFWYFRFQNRAVYIQDVDAHRKYRTAIEWLNDYAFDVKTVIDLFDFAFNSIIWKDISL